MLPVHRHHMRAFTLFANRAGLRYAQCNSSWPTSRSMLMFRITFAAFVATFITAPHWAWWPLFFCIAFVTTIDSNKGATQ